MTNDTEKIFQALRSVVLSEREKANMRVMLKHHVHAHPVTKPTSHVVAFFSRIEKFLNSNSLATHPAFALSVLVLMIGVGTSYAAHSSLPGEPLYAFKTRVNEPIEGVLALSPSSKTEWSAELTYRRLQEAEELAALGEINPVASADIEKGIATALSRFDTSVQQLQETDDAEAAEAQSDLEASLNAHEVVLASLSAGKKSNTARIATVVQEHVTKISEKRAFSEATLTATNSPQVKDAALKRKKSAEAAISEVQILSEKATNAALASSTLRIAQEAQNDMKAGESEAKNGRWGNAYNAFQDATRKAKESKSAAETRAWLKARFGVGIVDGVATTSTSTINLNIKSVTSDSDEDDTQDLKDKDTKKDSDD